MYILTTNVDEAQIRKLVQFLVKFFVRRHLTNTPNFRNLDMLFIEQIEELRKSPNNIDLVIGNLKSKSASEDEFKQKMRGSIYDDNRAACRFILCKIEESCSTPETKVDLWQRKDSKYRFEIEHVFPQGENIPQDWIDMIAGGDRKLAEARQIECVHKLGNLTLTAFNKELRNWPFDKKRDNMKSGEYIGYKNGLYLNRVLASKSEWTKDDITERTDELVKQALDIFKFSD
jgi:hypothetical protein